jgi:hypothetical protein
MVFEGFLCYFVACAFFVDANSKFLAQECLLVDMVQIPQVLSSFLKKTR